MAASSSSSSSSAMFAKIVQCPTRRFFGIVGKGSFETCGPVFNRLDKIVKSTPALMELCPPSTADKEERDGILAMLVLSDVKSPTSPDNEWACAVMVPPDDEALKPPEGLEEIVVPGRRCATAVHRGSYRTLPDTWGKLCSEWVPSQDLRLLPTSRDNVAYEIYVKGCDDLDVDANSKRYDDEGLETQIFCPIEE